MNIILPLLVLISVLVGSLLWHLAQAIRWRDHDLIGGLVAFIAILLFFAWILAMGVGR
jgi:uncharacterized protein involved in cysteine biosynthesis